MAVFIGRPSYAQTNLQLWQQLQGEGYSDGEKSLVHNTYEFARRLYSGFFIASGRTQIAHLVGTASILSTLRVPGVVVAAGLIHNVYENADFGSCRDGPTAAKRAATRRAVGEEVERYVHHIYVQTVGRQSFSSILNQIDAMEFLARYAVLIKICDRFEHRVNDGGLEQYTKYVDKDGPMIIEVTRRLGFPVLARQIQQVIARPDPEASVLEGLISRITESRSRWIVPMSCRKHFTLVALEATMRGYRWIARSKTASRVIRMTRVLRSAG